MSEKEKMQKGVWYDANNDEELCKERAQAEELCFLLNHLHPGNCEEKARCISKLLPNADSDITILSPFYTDYGYNCFIEKHTFINRNAYLMDGAKITIGEHCFIGPNCGLYTANHPLCWQDRNKGYEKAEPITIEKNVWIGADVTILPGVTIRKGAVIGAKSVVTEDIPAHVIAFGNPCKIIRTITEKDAIKYD